MHTRTLFFVLSLALAWALATPPAGAETVRVGVITTLSGPGAGLGIDIRDGFRLALAQLDGRLGGEPTEVVEVDDQRKPALAVQLANRLIQRDRVQILTGIVWSNLALAIMPTAARNKVFFVSANAGPSALAGAGCNPFFFNVAWQNDNNHEVVGQYVQEQGFEKLYVMAPNYPAGHDAITGFRRFYTGPVVGEVYTPLGQLDYAAELAQLRAADPDAVFIFYPGGMGINFVKQYQQAGLADQIPLFGPAFSFSQDILGAVGPAALGVRNGAQWSPDLDIAANQRFVEAFTATYGRLPSLYASQGYDAALLIDAAVRATGGELSDATTLRRALKTVRFDTVRGRFAFNNNHYPIQDFYLREVVALDDGTITNRIVGKVFEAHGDAYAADCPMP